MRLDNSCASSLADFRNCEISGPADRSEREVLASTLPGAQPPKREATSDGRAPCAPRPGARITPPNWDNGNVVAANVAPMTAPTVPAGMSADAFKAAISAKSDSSTETPDAVTAS